MKISKELFKKYVAGESTTEERRFVEAWLESEEGMPSPMSEIDAIKSKERIWKRLKGRFPLISQQENSSTSRPSRILFFNRAAKLAAAACIIFAAFFGGRVSAKNTSSKTFEEKSFNEHLYFVGGGELKGSLPGKDFKIEFDDILRLYNASKKKQSVAVGDSTFILHPGLYYFLEGSTQNPKFVNPLVNGNKNLVGAPSAKYVSIVRTDKL